MKTVKNWLGAHLVPSLASLAFVVVVVSWVLDAFYGLGPIGTLPLFYDLSLAFLTGCFFQLLVVWLPERRRARETVETVRASLMMAARNGEALVRDLEFTGRCPERPITPQHVELVVRANNDNEARAHSSRSACPWPIGHHHGAAVAYGAGLLCEDRPCLDPKVERVEGSSNSPVVYDDLAPVGEHSGRARFDRQVSPSGCGHSELHF